MRSYRCGNGFGKSTRHGEIKVERQIDRKVALTDACYSSELGEGFLDAVRGLHRAVGMEVVELENNRFDNLTCGTVSILRNHYDLGEGAKETKKRWRRFSKQASMISTVTAPDAICSYAALPKGSKYKTHYALEEILWAFGDDYPVPLEERAAKQTGLFIEKVKASFAG